MQERQSEKYREESGWSGKEGGETERKGEREKNRCFSIMRCIENLTAQIRDNICAD